MELGRYLVSKLGLEEGVDTLGRWMAHHLAEQINAVDKATTEEERAKARIHAIETILKIWEHRKVLPGHAYPLASYTDVLLILDKLRPDNNPYKFFGYDSSSEVDRLTAFLFDDFARLILALLLKKAPNIDENDEDDVAMRALDETEQQILQSLHNWAELFKITEDNTSKSRSRKSRRRSDNVNYDQAAVHLIDELMDKLINLREELRNKSGTTYNSEKID